MSDMDRVLAPLQGARAAVEDLETYATPQELAVALEAIGQAVERSLRQLLRRDASMADETRLRALDPAVLPFERVIVALRQQERISLDAAHAVHELEQARQRAAAGTVRAADADQAARTVRLLIAELESGAATRADDDSLRSSAHAAVTRGDVESAAHEVPRSELQSWQRKGLVLALTLVVLAVISWGVLKVFGGESTLEQGVAAYDAGQLGVAEQHFRNTLEDEDDGATAAVYLGRVLRRQERFSEARAVLNAARKKYPEDTGILRELGHMLARDLLRPSEAAPVFQRAVELEPEVNANWVALIQVLRGLGDPAAEQWLARAPDSVRAALTRPLP